MFLFNIVAAMHSTELRDLIKKQLELLKKDNFDIICEDLSNENTLYIKCGLKDNILSRLTDHKQYEDFKFNISKTITDCIVQFWEPKLLKRILKDNYFYLNETEKENVHAIANRLLEDEKPILPGGFYRITRRNKIMRALLEYLAADDTINIDGFVNFRLHVYIKDLSETVERSIEIYVAEKEYNEFIKLLKYFVDIQECKLDIVHLRQHPDGSYILLDQNLNSVHGEYFDDIRSDISEDNINFDDLLISTLITISPKKVYLHDADSFTNKELIKTIKSVFADRITVCQGCELCRSNFVVEARETNKYSL